MGVAGPAVAGGATKRPGYPSSPNGLFLAGLLEFIGRTVDGQR